MDFTSALQVGRIFFSFFIWKECISCAPEMDETGRAKSIRKSFRCGGSNFSLIIPLFKSLQHVYASSIAAFWKWWLNLNLNLALLPVKNSLRSSTENIFWCRKCPLKHLSITKIFITKIPSFDNLFEFKPGYFKLR